MKKPDKWYAFKIGCDLYDFGQSNMSPSSSQQYCNRKDRQGKTRPYWVEHRYCGYLKCHWNVCPKLKELRKKAKDGQVQTCPKVSIYSH